MSVTSEKYSAKVAELASLDSQIAIYRNSYQSWYDAAKKKESECPRLILNKRKECEADRDYKYSQAAQAQNTLNSLLSQRATLLQEIDSLKRAMDAESQATVNLSTQGLSQAALIAKAEGEANAAKIRAEAEANAITTTAETNNNSKQLIIGAIVVVVVIAGIIIVKRIAKAKKKK